MRRDGWCLLGDHLGDDRLRRAARVRWIARQHLVQHRTQGVHVTPGVQLPIAHRLFGTHVVRGADREPRLGQPRASGLGDGERDPEVRHQRLAVVDQYVLGLDVAVNHVVPMRIVQRGRHRLGNVDRLVDAQLLLALDFFPQGVPFHVRHHVEQEAVRFARIVERQDVRVLEVGGDPDFVQEPLGTDQGREFRAQHLERHLAVVLGVIGQVDGGHPALAQLSVDLVAIGEC